MLFSVIFQSDVLNLGNAVLARYLKRGVNHGDKTKPSRDINI